MKKKLFELKLLKFIVSVSFITIICVGCGNSSVNNTTVEQSRYNNIAPSEYYKEMKSDNLEYADIAWQAKKTYGWNCDEVISLGEKIFTSGDEIQDSYLKSQIKGYYQVATCSSDVQLRVYPRENTYPIITNIDGGWD